MKKHLLTICALLLIYQTYAQSFVPASIVRSGGELISGCLRLDYSATIVRFKANCDGEVKTYSVSDISTFHIQNLTYERRKVDGHMLFLQELVTGEATLYLLEQKPFGKNRYFLQVKDEFEELTYSTEEVVINNQRYQKADANYLKTFTRLLGDCSEFTNSTWGTGFTNQVLINTVAAYNDCKQRNGSKEKVAVSPMSLRMPTKFFVRLGPSVTIIPSSIIRETNQLYTRHIAGSSSAIFGNPNYNFDDQGSRLESNWGYLAAIGLEKKIFNGKVSWGGQLAYSSSRYKKHLLTGGTTDAYTDQYNYMNDQNYEISVPKGKPIRFDGTIEDNVSIAQADLFARKYIFANQSVWYLGIGASYGFIQSKYTSAIKLYATDSADPVYLGNMIRYAEPLSTKTSQIGGLFEVGWQKGQKVSFVARYSLLYTQQISLLVNYYLLNKG